jgi:hypothetical protein
MRYSPFLTCQQAARLITARLDRPLNPIERIGLKMHLRICDACPKVIRQFDLIRHSMLEWRDVTEQ